MDFFQHQDRARRKTLLLVGLLGLAIASLIALTTVLMVVILASLQNGGRTSVQIHTQGTGLFALSGGILTPELLLTLATGVITVVLLGSLYKWLQLRSGGRAIAEALGGQLLLPDSTRANERKILNVVEEMAIAAGLPVPPVYLLDEDGINAFAAGYQPQDAVIGITRGAINLLTRDELQGVVAHEFSHILYGDMRLNSHLVSALHGILVIGLLGRLLLRGSHRTGRRSKGEGGVAIVGLGLLAIGYTGIFFGNLIKAAVSRQREYLADAAAVQFTRNPQGIAGALQKIGGFMPGSRLHHPNADEFSHLYFGPARRQLGGLLATHPPLAERIRRLQPHWHGAFPVVTPPPGTTLAAADSSSSDSTPTDGPHARSSHTALLAASAIDSAVASAGNLREPQLQQARQLLDQLPERLITSVRTPFGAEAVVYALLLDPDPARRDAQLQQLHGSSHPASFRQLPQVLDDLQQARPTWRLPLLELALPVLKQLSEPQFGVFKRNLAALIRSDGSVSLREWSTYRMVTHNLQPPAARHNLLQLAQAAVAAQMLLSFMAHTSPHPAAAYRAGAAELDLTLPLLAPPACRLPQVDAALVQLRQLRPLHKPRLLKALGRCICQDQQIAVEEAEIFRAIADSLNCPVPLLTPAAPD